MDTHSDSKILSEIVHIARSNKYGLIGYLVIDKLINGRSFGGIRVEQNISLYELQLTARTMTYKNLFIGRKIGGAKAAVIISKENVYNKKEIFDEFGKSISSFVRRKAFFPGMDMGITLEELQFILDSTGYGCNVSSWKNLSHEYTAYSCFISTLCALEIRGISIRNATFSVQGFGRIGTAYASLMCKAGAKMIAFSNRCGGLIEEHGHNHETLENLLEERTIKGDEFILCHPKEKLASQHSVLELDVNVLLLASTNIAINEENISGIKADIIICAANAPMLYDTERTLFNHGKIVVTSFVANCGGILGSIMDNYVNREVVFHILSSSYRYKIMNMLYQSIKTNTPIVDIAIAEVEKKIETGFTDVGLTGGEFAKKMLYLCSNTILDPIRTRISNYLSKKFVSTYESAWVK
jgi:glutamate dehydrogenase (NAD(P)+)